MLWVFFHSFSVVSFTASVRIPWVFNSFFTCVHSLIQLTYWDLMSMITCHFSKNWFFVMDVEASYFPDDINYMLSKFSSSFCCKPCFPHINIYYQLFTVLAFLKGRCACLYNWDSLSAKEESSDVGQENEFQSPAAWNVISDFTFPCLGFPTHKKKAMIAPPLQGFGRIKQFMCPKLLKGNLPPTPSIYSMSISC